ncbi:MAG: polymer-forming cytoskeletal protein, partial [Chthoniobacterales bacterium]|nr:polymer-forming cytoskeletal protein [Chthoniobacterales bacterium]
EIRAEIKTKSIIVFGKVQGNITVGERCELNSRSTLQGDLKAARLVIEEGATFVGKSEVTSGVRTGSNSRPEIVRNDEPAAPLKAAFRRSRLAFPSQSVAKSGPAKLGVECPHCGFKQSEYAAAKSTMCRQCGGSFSPAAPKAREINLRTAGETQPAPAASDHPASMLKKLEGFWGEEGSSTVRCFECGATQEVIAAASSTICPKCSAHVDLRDYKITTNFNRAIRTHGEVHVTPRGGLSSSQIVCRSALIEGKLRGDLHCSGTCTVNSSGKVAGRVSAAHVLVERKSEVQFFRRVRAKSVEIRGHMTGEVIAESAVVIHRNGSLNGNVTAKSISVEKGGMFSGQLVIGSSSLTQAELLPAKPPSTTPNFETPGFVQRLLQEVVSEFHGRFAKS